MIKSLFLGIFGLIITYVIYVLFHTGAFRPVEISMYDSPTMRVVFKKRLGAYHKAAESIAEVEKYLSQFNIDCRKSFGRFYDDPGIVDEDRLRSEAGCLSVNGQASEEQKIFTDEISAGRYVRAVFSGSPAIGPIKVYPKVEDYIQENRLKQDGPIIEIYTLHSGDQMTTEYLFPVAD